MSWYVEENGEWSVDDNEKITIERMSISNIFPRELNRGDRVKYHYFVLEYNKLYWLSSLDMFIISWIECYFSHRREVYKIAALKYSASELRNIIFTLF